MLPGIELDEYKVNVKKLRESGGSDELVFVYTDMILEHNLPLFCQVVLSHMFTNKIGKVHREIMDLLISGDQFALVAIPRKHGKTTILKGFLIWVICYKKFDYILWVGNTVDKVAMHLTNVKKEISMNDILIQIYGQLDKKGDLTKWNHDEILLDNGFHLKCIGANSAIRGVLDIKAPDLALVDDLDDDEAVENANSRMKLDSWFYNVLLTAIDQYTGKVRMFGTVIHNDCQLVKVHKNPTFTSMLYACVDEDKQVALCPEMYSYEYLMKKKEMLFKASPPKVQTWWQEWMNQPTNPDNAQWDVNKLNIYDAGYSDGCMIFTGIDGNVTKVRVRTLTAVDIASSKGKQRSDKTVVLTIAVDADWNVYILKYFRKTNAKPSETVQAIIDHHRAYRTEDLIMEQIGVMDLIMETYDTMALKEKSMPCLTEIRSRGNIAKADRISWALQDKLRQDKIHYRDGMSDLLDEFETFPRGAHDDLLDALSDCVRNGYPPLDDIENVSTKSKLPWYLDDDNSSGGNGADAMANRIVNL